MCGKEKPLSEFTERRKSKKDGSVQYKSWCKVCCAEYKEKYMNQQTNIRQRERYILGQFNCF